MKYLLCLVLVCMPVAALAQDAAPTQNTAPTQDAAPPQNAAPVESFTRDTPVEKIAADPGGKAVLDRDIPGLLTDAQYPMFKSMSLHQLQVMSGGELSAETVDKAETDLKALPVK